MITGTLNAFAITVLLLFLAASAWVDVNERRIPNGIVVHGIIVALVIVILSAGPPGLVWSLAGLIIAGAMLLPFYALGGMGAGDVKLAAMVGAYLGPEMAVAAVSFTLVSGVFVALAYLLAWRVARSALGRRLSGNFRHSHSRGLHTCHHDEPHRPDDFPYALAILAGTVCALIWSVQAGQAASG